MTSGVYTQRLEVFCRELRSDALAFGHDLHPWVTGETNERRTACRGCGARLVVAIRLGEPIVVRGTAHISGCGA